MKVRVTISPVPHGPSINFDLLGDDTITGGVGGWESLARSRRSPAAGWVGLPEVTYTLPLMIDGFANRPRGDRVIEADCRRLADWGRPVGPNADPPVLKIAGPVMVTPGARWVLQDIAWGSRIRNDKGHRVQQQVTLTLLQYVETRLVTSPAKRARDRRSNR